MRYEYLSDSDFLKKIDLMHLKEQFVKITILDWYERPVQDLTGKAISGNINIDGTSSVRRTASLTVFLENNSANRITNPNNFLSINKKIKMEVGFTNTFQEYSEYETLWFPVGVYVITSMSISHSLQGITVSLQLKDKMCLLNGECGGVIPASVNFSEIESIDGDGGTVITKPTIYRMIQELVNHWGKEQLGKIIISDIDNRIKKVMKWAGGTPLYCYSKGNETPDFTTSEKEIEGCLEVKTLAQLKTATAENPKYIKYDFGRDIGYIYTDFVYPGPDLIGSIGDSVCDILDKIRNLLGNYEYFYDLDGNFVFQEVKNYLNISHSTMLLDKINNSDYLIDQSKGKSVYHFDDSTLINSYNNSPRFEMIKNDFLVWGMREGSDGSKLPIRYHLAIDTKPEVGKPHIVFRYKDEKDQLYKAKAVTEVASEKDLPRPGTPGRFYYVSEFNPVQTDRRLNEKDNPDKVFTYGNLQVGVYFMEMGDVLKWDPSAGEDKKGDYTVAKSGKTAVVVPNDWRTELYLQGLDIAPYGTDSNPYYVELQNEWPKLFDIWDEKNPHFYQKVLDTPSTCDFFLDFIDSESAIGEFNVSNIGRRTKVVVDDKINCLFRPEIPNLILLKDISGQQECIDKGQSYTVVDPFIYSSLSGGGSARSAYEEIRDLLYQYTSYNESISLTCIPIYYLDVNTRISVSNPSSDISGDYMIKTISLPLAATGEMSINAIKALDKI